jgi:hypothetical protein
VRKYREILFLLAFLLIAKLSILLFTDFGNNKLTAEEKTYLHFASALYKHGDLYSPEGRVSRMPGYVIALVTVKKVARSYILLYKIMNIILSLVTAVFVYFALNDKKRLIGAAFVSLMPPYFVLYEFIYAENLAVPLSAIALFFLLKFRKSNDIKTYCIFNLVNFCLMMTLPETILAVIAVNAYLSYKQPRLRYPFIGLVVMFNFWVVYASYIVKDYPTVTSQTAYNFYQAVYPEATGTTVNNSSFYESNYLYALDMHGMKDKDEPTQHKMITAKAYEYLFKNPWTFISQIPTRIGYFMNMEIDEVEALISRRRVHRHWFAYYLFYVALSAWYFVFWVYTMRQLFTKNITKMYLVYWLGAMMPYIFVVAEARYKLSFIPVFVAALLVRKRE